MAKKTKPTRTGEFSFEDDTTNSGKLTYRCLEFVVTSENDEWTASELSLWRQIVETLNESFVGEPDEDEDD